MKTIITAAAATLALVGTAAAGTVVIDFEDRAGGDIVTNQYEGVRIQGRRVLPDGTILRGQDRAMIYDTRVLTGGDADLVGPFIGEDGVMLLDPDNILIVSEDGDAADPDDSGSGGRIVFDFDEAVTFQGFNAFDINDGEGLVVQVFGLGGELIARLTNGDRTSPDNGYMAFEDLMIEGASRIAFVFSSSGGIDDIAFDTAPVPVPAAALLFATGAGGLFARRKRAG